MIVWYTFKYNFHLLKMDLNDKTYVSKTTNLWVSKYYSKNTTIKKKIIIKGETSTVMTITKNNKLIKYFDLLKIVTTFCARNNKLVGKNLNNIKNAKMESQKLSNRRVNIKQLNIRNIGTNY